ncbi:hypothetical protein XELAEV_18004101mg [Xenopus laevis]|uniref:Uncharacterized protein n=1 Tax=Xenopus laevis TaxID=8355 RepID=A0A974GYZ5_XENLA|nr:hypothetical protein XELAEV_18004101mg [Xenopus laevis]
MSPTHLLSPPYCPHGSCLCFPPLVPDLDKGNMYLATMLVHKSRAGGRYQGAEGQISKEPVSTGNTN